jgi:hypothetical protein
MMKKILIGGGVVVVALGAAIAMQPDTFHIERSIEMNAAPEAAFAQVNDFHAWVAWSPWEKLDPNLKRTYEGAPAGVGAKYSWLGNKDVGAGRMTIEQSTTDKIAIKLEFLAPFEATNTATFTFVKTASGTKTTWAMDGKNNIVGKAMGLVMNVDEILGPDFERGLASMKHAAEAAAKAPVVTATNL